MGSPILKESTESSPRPPKQNEIDREPMPDEQTIERSIMTPDEKSKTDIGRTRIDGESIEEILAMGFSEASARRCLKNANGNVQLAVSMLLSEALEAGG